MSTLWAAIFGTGFARSRSGGASIGTLTRRWPFTSRCARRSIVRLEWPRQTRVNRRAASSGT